MYNNTQARQVAANWHGGQNSALYSFASTGTIDRGIEDYKTEISDCRASGREKRKLEKLFIYLCWCII